jgi:hypothetical protein
VNSCVANDAFTLPMRNASSGTAHVAVSRAFNRDPIRASDCETSLTYRLNSLRRQRSPQAAQDHQRGTLGGVSPRPGEKSWAPTQDASQASHCSALKEPLRSAAPPPRRAVALGLVERALALGLVERALAC